MKEKKYKFTQVQAQLLVDLLNEKIKLIEKYIPNDLDREPETSEFYHLARRTRESITG